MLILLLTLLLQLILLLLLLSRRIGDAAPRKRVSRIFAAWDTLRRRAVGHTTRVLRLVLRLKLRLVWLLELLLVAMVVMTKVLLRFALVQGRRLSRIDVASHMHWHSGDSRSNSSALIAGRFLWFHLQY